MSATYWPRWTRTETRSGDLASVLRRSQSPCRFNSSFIKGPFLEIADPNAEKKISFPFLIFYIFKNIYTLFFRSFLSSQKTWALASMAQLFGVSSCKPKGHGFNSQSGHIPRLWVRSLVGAHTGGNQSMFLSYINVSLSLPPFLSL